MLYCVLLCTQSTLQSCGGVSPQLPPVCSIHLDDATAATGQRRQCVHHTPAAGEEERESYIIYSITHTYFHFNLHNTLSFSESAGITQNYEYLLVAEICIDS